MLYCSGFHATKPHFVVTVNCHYHHSNTRGCTVAALVSMPREEVCFMATGKVKWFDGKKGYGFIVPAEGASDVFVHYTAIQTQKEFKTLREGMMVQFDVMEGKRGLQAQNVVVLP